jgi:hypothetical protein
MKKKKKFLRNSCKTLGRYRYLLYICYESLYGMNSIRKSRRKQKVRIRIGSAFDWGPEYRSAFGIRIRIRIRQKDWIRIRI